MGLFDVLNGMQNGPRGPKDATASGGMSPITMAILALLAYKAVKHLSGSTGTATAPTGGSSTLPGSTTAPTGGLPTGGLSGGLGGLLQGNLGGLLGGLLAGGAAGSVLSGGLNDLLKQFQEAGHGDAANSWVSPGSNKPITSDDLASALGADQINTLTSQTGLSRNELLDGLAQQLPEFIHQLTPDGRLPNEQEASRWL
ncbi:protein of unknown function [Afipia carboxidovorans OM5]|uniref:DUF937 domain-containing protein n=1 Tax=Afipia carboxidovorans (strain ATCC 49405 / DSM 1227 / KCTC 32145 / OM5) TaxID=504832 RepID=B6J9Y4_AFIC5|nr:YidB family protein [Afipia carboxidovorans]ACI91205.1 protein of unknown function [Afipia carboxidovorans OM5]AEI01602.1 hypothetical protein OCA4_c04510 [Afipia carboxidovorans OM4]AEI05177.1 hypothetical protein OCA5_c04520 [Afipia carboxidovorans OM5]